MNKSEQLIACLEGEIAKRDEGLAECRVAVENCELFRARIAELERQLNSDKLIKMVAELRAELAAVKAQWAAMPKSAIMVGRAELALVRSALALDCEQGRPVRGEMLAELDASIARLDKSYAAPVSEAKAQGVVMQASNFEASNGEYRNPGYEGQFDGETVEQAEARRHWATTATELATARLNAAPVQQVSVPDERGAFEREAVERYGYTWASIYSRRQGLGYSDSSLCMAWIMWKARAMLAAPAAPAADAGLVEALALCVKSLDQLLPYLGKVPADIGLINNALMAARPALAAHRAKGVA